MWIVWPSFLVASVLEMLVFAMIDPHDLHWFGQPVSLSRQAVYTLVFFVLWLATIVSSTLTVILSQVDPTVINRPDY